MSRRQDQFSQNKLDPFDNGSNQKQEEFQKRLLKSQNDELEAARVLIESSFEESRQPTQWIKASAQSPESLQDRKIYTPKPKIAIRLGRNEQVSIQLIVIALADTCSLHLSKQKHVSATWIRFWGRNRLGLWIRVK